MAAAGRGQADGQGLREGWHPCEARGAITSRWGTERQEETQGSLTAHRGLDWHPWGERKLQMPGIVVCSLLSYDVVGAGKSWEASGGCGEGANCPLSRRRKRREASLCHLF